MKDNINKINVKYLQFNRRYEEEQREVRRRRRRRVVASKLRRQRKKENYHFKYGSLSLPRQMINIVKF